MPEDHASEPPYYWTLFPRGKDLLPPGEELAALRRGLGQPAGSVPDIWRFYVHLAPDDRPHPRLQAEHVALSLFGLHQQSQRSLMHRPGVPLAAALHRLRSTGRFSEEALDRRVAQAAAADQIDELAHHLRGLVSMLKAPSDSIGLDYTVLVTTLNRWRRVEGRARERRLWGSRYFQPMKDAANHSTSRSEAAGKDTDQE